MHTETEQAAWLQLRQHSGTTQREALEFFDALPIIPVDALRGRWRGSGLATGHPMDGMLEEYGWYGKEFTTAEDVHPLLFVDGRGEVAAVESRFLPVRMMLKPPGRSRILRALFSVLRPILRTTEPRARLRMLEHRGKVSATMIYDFLPIHDVFRRVDADTVLGLMDLRGMALPFFFVLRRE